MDNLNILVTGIGGGGNGEQILKALRLSKDLLLNIIGTDLTEDTTGLKLVDIFYKVPIAKDPKYKKIIFDIIKKHNIKFMFHGSEPELKFMSANRDELAANRVFHPMNTPYLIELCMNKCNTYKKLIELGIEVPMFWKIDKLDDVKNIDRFPVVMKPNSASSGSSNIFIAVDMEEALLFGQYMLKRKMDVIAQEYTGTEKNEYTIGVNSDENGKIIGCIIIKREITNALSTKLKVNDNGKNYMISSGLSQGYIITKPELQLQAENFALKLDSRGPLNIQCRTVNGKLMLMEINPRLSGTTSLRAIAGYNEPVEMIKHFIFNKPWNLNYRETKILRTIQEVEILGKI